MDLARWPAAAARATNRYDVLLAVGIASASLIDIDAETSRHPVQAALLAVAVLLGLAWRRRAPVVVLLAVCLLDLVLSATSPGPYPPQLVLFGVLLAIYSAAAHTAGPRAVLAGGTSLVLVWVGHGLTGDGELEDFLPAVIWGGPWLAGRMVRRRTLEAAAAATHATDVLRRREQELHEARVRERDRIARELHDVVAHAVSLMVVQAGAERLRLGADAPRTTEVLDAVESAGRQALTDLRAMLALLRDGADHDPLAPQPRLADVAPLVERVRAAGLPVELVQDAPAQVAPALGLSAYRIVQEALTNVLKHAGPVPTTVRVGARDGALEVEVRSALSGRVPDQRTPGGRGLLGMQERASLHGGSVVCGPVDGCWAVRATLPLVEA